MIEYKDWPPPEDWTSVKLSWDWVMQHHTHNTNDIYNWVIRAPGGRFHISGYNVGKPGEGFDYRFERPADATYFSLNLPR